MPEPSYTSSTPEASHKKEGDVSSGQIKVTARNVLWPLLLSLLVLVGIGYFTFDPDDFSASIDRINPFYMLAAIATIFFRVWFGAWRFSFISQGKLGFWQGLRGQLSWDFFSNVTQLHWAAVLLLPFMWRAILKCRSGRLLRWFYLRSYWTSCGRSLWCLSFCLQQSILP